MSGAFKLAGVEKSYGGLCVLKGVNAAFELGRVHVVTGPSGCGKTTLLRLLMGLEDVSAGRVERPDGVRLAATFQEDRLCEGLTATANIRLVHGHLSGAERAAFLARSREALAATGVTEAEGRPVRELSGGQRRRVALLRCVLADADALFFDEPLKGMDDVTIEQVMGYVTPLLAGRTVFWVTHDERELAWFDRPVRWRVVDGSILGRVQK